MRHSHHNDSPLGGAESPHWIDRLGGIILPATAVAILFSIGAFAYVLMGKHIEFNPDTIWVLWAYLGVLAAGNAVYWSGRLRKRDHE